MEIELFYSAFELWGGFFFLMASFILWFSGGPGNSRRARVWPELITGLMLIADSVAYFFRGGSSDLAHILVIAGNFIALLGSFWVGGAFFQYLSTFIPKQRRKNYIDWWKPMILLISGFDTILLIVSQFTGILYTIDKWNVYQRGSFMILAMGLQFVLVLSYLIIAIREKLWTILFIVGGAVVAIVVQILIYGYPFTNIICMIAAIILFVRELLTQTKKSEGKEILISEKEETIREMQTRIALSQIKPHFLYNALNSIYVLCGRDMNEARYAISHLSDYLRSNMAAIDSKFPIPFSREMELVESYLAIEKIRFPEELNYTIVTPVTHFSLPALTVQPLVENAVRHGIMPLDSGGIITITTRETEQDFIVSITDNGVGFDMELPDPPEGSADHIGLKNVKERLRRLSGGDLVIRSSPGHGTEAVIRIPKQAGKGE